MTSQLFPDSCFWSCSFVPHRKWSLMLLVHWQFFLPYLSVHWGDSIKQIKKNMSHTLSPTELIQTNFLTGNTNQWNYYTSDSLWKIWLVENIQSIHNSLWHDKCNICCRYCIYHVKFKVCLVTKPLGVFSSETKWLNASLLFLRMNYVKNV